MKKLLSFVAISVIALSVHAQSISTSANSICNGDSVILTFGVSSTDTVTLQIIVTGSISTMVAVGDTLPMYPITSTIYQIIEVNGSPVTPSLVSVNVSQHPTISVSNGLIGCNTYKSTALLISGSLPASYSWSNSALNSNETTFFGGDTITLSVTDNSGCATDTTFVMPIMQGITVDSIVTTVQTCNSGTASVFAHGSTPLDILWLNDTVHSSSRNDLVAGTYNIRISDTNFCSLDTTIVIGSQAALRAIVTQQNVGCFGNSDGRAEAIAIYGTAPYCYQWNTGSIDSVLTNLSAGMYTVVVTDANGCTDTASVSIAEPSPIITSIQTTNSGNDTILTANASGGYSPYSYLWNTGDTTNVIRVSAGMYTVVVTDANGCTSTSTVTVNAIPSTNSQLVFDLSAYANICHNIGPIVLTNYVTISPNNGGTLWFVGAGVVDGVFYPSTVSIGTYQIIAYYRDTNGVVLSAAQSVAIHGPTTLDWNFPYSYININSQPIELTGGYPSGGTYSGDGVYSMNGSYFFDPAVAGVGLHQLFYEYTNSFGCYSNISRNVTVSSNASVDDVCQNQVTVYPNPVQDVLHIDTEIPIENTIVYDVLGNQISVNVENNTIDLSRISTGVYFLHLVCNGKTQIHKIIKN